MAFMNGWEYCNVKVPLDMAYQMTGEDVRDMLLAFVGYDTAICASTGYSPFGPYEEGDIDYDADGNRCSLHYDFIEVDGKARVFRYCID